MGPIVKASGLVKRYGGLTVVDGIDFEIIRPLTHLASLMRGATLALLCASSLWSALYLLVLPPSSAYSPSTA